MVVTIKFCAKFFFAGECPSKTFDILRTCSELGEWCYDPAARNGCLGCKHCDSNDRRRNKCPECFTGNENIDELGNLYLM